ncbi:MAG TPA: mRNA surveillance protein pelota [Candidatus Nanoarchaeia archaeon]|nr:mRNA surveillance protein pelota [Candidatus Nanoarchaeia archaeon]
MKRIAWNLRKGEIKVKVESLDDLWTLRGVISQGDVVSGRSERKVRKGEKDQRSRAVIKRHFQAIVEVERVEFAQSQLRISGKLSQGTEDIPKGSYHTIVAEPFSVITVKKLAWPVFILKKVQDACNPSPHSILLVVFDREEAVIARLQRQGYEVLMTLAGEVQKKREPQKVGAPFFEEIKKALKEISDRNGITHIIVASPAFWKDEIRPILENAKLPQLIYASCSSVGPNGIAEVLKRPEIASALKEERAFQEFAAVEELMVAIAKAKPVAYGSEEVNRAQESGAVAKVVVADVFLQERPDADALLAAVERQKGSVVIVSSSHEAGKKLLGLGGIGALLRYRVS